MRCGIMVWYSVEYGVCCDARCEMWLWNTDWCGMVWRHIRHGRCDGSNAVWNVCCGIVWCAIYIWMSWVMYMAWWWNVGVMWNGALRCGGVIEVNYGAMSDVAISDNVWLKCKMCDVECGVCGMLHNAKCGKLRCDAMVWNCGEEDWCGLCNVLCDRCASDVENDAIVKSSCGSVMRSVEYVVVWNRLWCWMWVWCGMVWDVDCDVEHVVLRDVVVWNGAEADNSVLRSQM